jgi:hypothetical protein
MPRGLSLLPGYFPPILSLAPLLTQAPSLGAICRARLAVSSSTTLCTPMGIGNMGMSVSPWLVPPCPCPLRRWPGFPRPSLSLLFPRPCMQALVLLPSPRGKEDQRLPAIFLSLTALLTHFLPCSISCRTALPFAVITTIPSPPLTSPPSPLACEALPSMPLA